MASLHFKYAPMEASKSTQLLMTAYNYEKRGMSVFLIKPKLDTRDGEYVVSRALETKRKVDWVLEDCESVYDLIRGETDAYRIDAILIDEAQFLTVKQVDQLGEIVDNLQVPVLAYGLLTDANTNLFDASKRLLEISDKKEEFITICPCCGRRAIFNMRLNEAHEPVFGGQVVEVGFNYLPVCRKYYNKLKLQHEGEMK